MDRQLTGATTELLAASAYVWGYPYVAAARLRIARTLPDDPWAVRGDHSPGAPLNNLGRQRRTSDPSYRPGVGVSTDTLYSSAWLDLRDEPFVLEAPRVPERYYSFQAANADTSSEVAFGSRTHGEQLPPVFLHGPAYAGPVPDGMLPVRSTTRYLNLPGRVLVDPADPADVAEVHRIQDRIRLRPLSRFRAGQDGANPVPTQRRLEPPPSSTPELRFLHELGSVLKQEVVPAADMPLVATFAALGLSPANGFDETALSKSAIERAIEGLAAGRALVEQKSHHLGTQVGGWTINYGGPRFGSDHLLRAAVALDQIYVTVPEEGLYPLGKTDSDGAPLDGRNDYRIVFPGQAPPPVNAFWSVTLYSEDGFLVPNPTGIYSVGDRSEAPRDTEGNLTVRLGHVPPAGGDAWLPAPAGRFYLMLRLFAPRAEALDGSWLPPAIERVDR